MADYGQDVAYVHDAGYLDWDFIVGQAICAA